MFYLYQIIFLSFLASLILIYLKFKNLRKILSKILSIVFGFIISLEIISIYITRRLFDYHFYNYINFNYGEIRIKYFFLFIILTIAIGILLYFLSLKYKNILLSHKKLLLDFIGPFIIILILPNSIINKILQYDPIPTELSKLKKHCDINTYQKDKMRFIAHAGGKINNDIYTDSLEALNVNYKNGFRLFELDIIKTQDNIYVASHSWEDWARMTEYQGVLPPTRKVFLKYKILNKYTPMDITNINVWFKNHPDAILITDKINTPIDFSNKFIDKSRLMMELFSWEAVKKGISANIKAAIPTENILSQIQGNKVNYLKKLGIKYLATSYKIFSIGKDFITNAVNNGIKIYVFNLNEDKEINELYIACTKRNYFYGMYADKWNFNSTLNCSEFKNKTSKIF